MGDGSEVAAHRGHLHSEAGLPLQQAPQAPQQLPGARPGAGDSSNLFCGIF